MGKNIKSFLWLLAGCVIYGIGTHAFIEPADIAPGGAVGVALMINHVFSLLPVGKMILVINVPLLILAWFNLSKGFTIRTTFACVLNSFVLDDLVAPICPVYAGDRLLSSLYGGILVGIGMAFIFISGSTTGGSDVVGYLVQKKAPHMPIGKLLLAIDGCILSVSAFVFGNIDAALFGMLSLYAQTKVIDAIIYGSDVGVQAQIVTKHPEIIVKKIIDVLDRSATILEGKGGYSGDKLSVVVCTARKSEFPQLKEFVYASDPDAFVMVTQTTEVYGLGFKDFVESH